MALRQRKADTVLPLHVSHNDKDDGRVGRPLMPSPMSNSPRKRSGANDPNLIYRVYIPIIGFFIVALGIAYLTIGGGLFHRHHDERPHEIMPHRHYHEHTAGRMKDPIEAKETKEPDAKASQPVNTPEPSSSEQFKMMAQQMAKAKALKSEVDNNNKHGGKKFKIRCPDGADGYLNDDYCDCEDGSDESKTSACSHLTVQKSTFHCLDGTGIIYASRVLDGVKDCLDGSDEMRTT